MRILYFPVGQAESLHGHAHNAIVVIESYFANVGENLNSCLTSLDRIDTERIMKVTPTIMNIELTWTKVRKEIVKLKQKKAGGPDNISLKLLKFADKSIVPSLLSVFQICAQTNIVPNKWKKANVTAIYKKEVETESENYRPISLICTPGKMMECCVASTLNNHLDEQKLGNGLIRKGIPLNCYM